MSASGIKIVNIASAFGLRARSDCERIQTASRAVLGPGGFVCSRVNRAGDGPARLGALGIIGT